VNKVKYEYSCVHVYLITVVSACLWKVQVRYVVPFWNVVTMVELDTVADTSQPTNGRAVLTLPSGTKKNIRHISRAVSRYQTL